MREHHVGGLVVVKEKSGKRVPVGIVTDRDLVIEVIAEGVDMGDISVGDIMSDQLVTAREGDDLLETIKMMRARGIRRLPVIDDDGALLLEECQGIRRRIVAGDLIRGPRLSPQADRSQLPTTCG